MSVLSIPFYVLNPGINTCLFKLASRRIVSEEMLAGTEIPGGGGRGRLYLTLHSESDVV